jgi:hypothetical protein
MFWLADRLHAIRPTRALGLKTDGHFRRRFNFPTTRCLGSELRHRTSTAFVCVTLGMSYADARPMLQRALPTAEIVVPRAAFQLNYKGVLVQTPDFANTVSVQRKQDETGSNEYLVLRFSGPASGNQLIAISRILNYADPLKAPTVSDVRAG